MILSPWDGDTVDTDYKFVDYFTEYDEDYRYQIVYYDSNSYPVTSATKDFTAPGGYGSAIDIGDGTTYVSGDDVIISFSILPSVKSPLPGGFVANTARPEFTYQTYDKTYTFSIDFNLDHGSNYSLAELCAMSDWYTLDDLKNSGYDSFNLAEYYAELTLSLESERCTLTYYVRGNNSDTIPGTINF